MEAVDPETQPGCTIQNSNLGRNVRLRDGRIPEMFRAIR